MGMGGQSGGSGSGVDGQSMTQSGGGRPHSNSVGSDVDTRHGGIMSSGKRREGDDPANALSVIARKKFLPLLIKCFSFYF